MQSTDGFLIEDDVLIGYQDAGGEVVIPEGVTELAMGAFFQYDDITSVRIPSSVRLIGCGVFEGCSSLSRVFFEHTKGWRATLTELDLFGDEDYTESFPIDSEELSDPERAAELFSYRLRNATFSRE